MTPKSFAQSLDQVVEYLASSRPTAVNLFWALQRMADRAASAAPQTAASGNPRRAVAGSSGRCTPKIEPCAAPSDGTGRRCFAMAWAF